MPVKLYVCCIVSQGEVKIPTSVTRFGKIPPLWQIFKNLWQYILGLFGFGKGFISLWHNLYAFGQIFIAVNSQILKTKTVIPACLLTAKHYR